MEIHSLLAYLLKSSGVFSILYGLYYLLFRKNQLFIANRIYLLFLVAFSLLFPLLTITSYQTVEIPALDAVSNLNFHVESVEIEGAEPSGAFWSNASLTNLILYLYLFITSAFFLRLLVQLVQFVVTLSKHSRIEKINGVKVVVSNYWDQTFSFFGIIVLTESDYFRSEKSLLLAHELAHVKQLHSLDLLLAELFQVIHWFNPLSYLLKKDMCEVHEYLADLQVVSGGVSKYAYQQLILDCVSNAIAPKVANAFSAKLIKNRFAMMTKNKITKRVLVRYLAILPIIGALIALMSFRTEFRYVEIPNTEPSFETNLVSNSEIAESNAVLPTEVKIDAPEKYEGNNFARVKNEPLTEISTISSPRLSPADNLTDLVEPKFEGKSNVAIASQQQEEKDHVAEMAARLKKIAGNETFLKDFHFANSNESKRYSIILKKGIVYRFYLVGAHKERMIENSVVLHKSKKNEEPKLITFNKVNKAKGHSYFDYDCDETSAYHLSVSETKVDEDYVVGLYLLESKISAQCDDKTQVGEKVVPITKSDSIGVASQEEVDADDPVFVVVEEMPKFSYEGMTDAREYFAKYLQYPKEAREKGIQGRVFVSFIVNKDGSVSDVKVERGVDPLLDNEVVRLVKNMPNWTPGKQRGQAVRVAYTFPVIFNLDKK